MDKMKTSKTKKKKGRIFFFWGGGGQKQKKRAGDIFHYRSLKKNGDTFGTQQVRFAFQIGGNFQEGGGEGSFIEKREPE